ncbi:protein kinase (plasmid) [Gemmatirosa kalamazoonensis]|uniref:Protein kinase n=1 Tax=Gemmatirosa kalamazoonensis TaxID=861299 RepID=W0RR25_9BACT|nr:serine/threonine-protein kinase [Gemmatirosa kalamazoonensis]AHG92755.1 protein kinase [Gemmatirosa kalamazoonensis]
MESPPAPPLDHSPLAPGAPFAERYAIEREIGRGGMATVYLAEERKHGRQVAIKVLRPDLTASVGAERFLREIGIVARLTHPHVVPLIDSGEERDPRGASLLYYVSPYVTGGSLRDRLVREGALPVADALRIAADIGTALDFAHRAGFVHRDVKPENILFADGHALLADFGVARARTACDEDGARAPNANAITDVGFTLGTPEYMSPEQASGERDVGVASDVYSLACVVYEMLAGEPPFRGPNARATMARHVTAPPPSVRTARPDAPGGIDEALAKALSKAPEQRHPSAADFIAALQAGAAAGAATRRALVATRTVAVLPFVNASPDPENEYLSDGITDELIDALAKLDGLRVASRTSVFALKGKPLDVRAIGALLGASAVLEGSVRKAGSRLRVTVQLTSTDDGRLLWSRRYDRDADDVFAVQDEIAQTIVTTLRATWLADLEDPRRKHYTRNLAAYGLYLRGRFALSKRTQEGVAEGIEYFERAIAEDPNYALAYTGLADAYALHVDYRSVPVADGLARANAYARRAIELDDGLAEAHASLAWRLFIYDWDWAGAEREFRRAIELDPGYGPAHQWYATLLVSQRRSEDALIEAHTALELDPGSVSARRSAGWVHCYARRFDQARRHLARAIEMNPTAEETFRVLGLTLAFDGKHEESVMVLRGAQQMPGAGTFTTATLGYALARAGERDEALAVRDALLERHAREYVSPAAISAVHIGLGEYDAALDWAERAHAERRGWLAYLAVNPIFDPMRAMPRFQALLDAMRLPR